MTPEQQQSQVTPNLNRYQLIQDTNLNQFNDDCSDMIYQGYIPIAGPFVYTTGSGNNFTIFYCQAFFITPPHMPKTGY